MAWVCRVKEKVLVLYLWRGYDTCVQTKTL